MLFITRPHARYSYDISLCLSVWYVENTFWTKYCRHSTIDLPRCHYRTIPWSFYVLKPEEKLSCFAQSSMVVTEHVRSKDCHCESAKVHESSSKRRSGSNNPSPLVGLVYLVYSPRKLGHEGAAADSHLRSFPPTTLSFWPNFAPNLKKSSADLYPFGWKLKVSRLSCFLLDGWIDWLTDRNTMIQSCLKTKRRNEVINVPNFMLNIRRD